MRRPSYAMLPSVIAHTNASAARLSLLRSGLLLVATSMLAAGCGVETYRERRPAPDLAIRMVASDGVAAETMPRWSASTSADGSNDEPLAVAANVVVSSRHIERVRLLDAVDGSRVLVLVLDDVGRARLEEASRENVGGRLAIVAGGRVIAAPTIREPLVEREAAVVVPPDALERAFDAIAAAP